MNLIVCEGKTDAIFLSYYLAKKFGWHFDKNESKKKILKYNDDQEYNVYRKDEKYLTIWSIGGCSNFSNAISHINDFLISSGEREALEKIIYMIDRDQSDSIDNLMTDFKKSPHPNINTDITEFKYMNGFGIENTAKAVVLIIPDNNNGALETIFLNALSSKTDNTKIIVEQTHSFIDDFDKFALTEYLTKNRDKLKAKFSTALNVMYPEKTFHKIDDLIMSIEWHECVEINELFKIFEDI